MESAGSLAERAVAGLWIFGPESYDGFCFSFACSVVFA
jgi:hypothetical protein